jgi:hypothetical protein
LFELRRLRVKVVSLNEIDFGQAKGVAEKYFCVEAW